MGAQSIIERGNFQRTVFVVQKGVVLEVWRRLRHYLDQALDLGETARAEWLTDIRSQDPALSEQIEALLREHESIVREGFLESGPRLAPERHARRPRPWQ